MIVYKKCYLKKSTMCIRNFCITYLFNRKNNEKKKKIYVYKMQTTKYTLLNFYCKKYSPTVIDIFLALQQSKTSHVSRKSFLFLDVSLDNGQKKHKKKFLISTVSHSASGTHKCEILKKNELKKKIYMNVKVKKYEASSYKCFVFYIQKIKAYKSSINTRHAT